MNLTQLWKTGLAVLFACTLTLSTIGCNGGDDAGSGESPETSSSTEGSGGEEPAPGGEEPAPAPGGEEPAPAPAE